MTKHYSGRDIEIIPPSRPAATVTGSSMAPVPPTPYRQNPGGIISGVPMRWQANSQAKTYEAHTRRAVAERKLVEADTELGRALVDNRRMRQEYSELPQILATDRAVRVLKRGEEIRELCHTIEIAEARRMQERARVELEMYATKEAFLEAEQKLEAQRHYGPRYHALQWEHRINEWELQVEEQRVVLGEHRRQHGRDELSLEDLHAAREQLNADGADTTPIDLAIARATVRQQRARK
ncbi:hypothetical protein IVB30_02760 [Bradyrhizobium sp. 200]|uniref:hypothetical protein n=1 Tax=Bradyrhizobium sp. 200 TaxID=2782665 RepID=UPI001FFEDDD5|nr:hypothetical protein [Bradyrhizobium sp. 200]UPJ50371.1 hypothetical protein IVB30_02760 [Bradyrhizobium sp. 200]